MSRRNSRRDRRSPNLRRGKYQREPKRRFILFCEGKNTESEYFRAIGRTCTGALIALEIVPAAGVPFTIAEKAVARARAEGLTPRRRRKMSSFEEADQVWAVFDRDEHPRYNEAVTLCKQVRVRVARSNPCFELWLILHEQEYDRYETRHEMQRLLGQIRPEYAKDQGKVPDCNDLVTRVEKAEQRAEVQLKKRTEHDDSFGNPSTTAGRLTYEIRPADKRATRSDS